MTHIPPTVRNDALLQPGHAYPSVKTKRRAQLNNKGFATALAVLAPVSSIVLAACVVGTCYVVAFVLQNFEILLWSGIAYGALLVVFHATVVVGSVVGAIYSRRQLGLALIYALAVLTNLLCVAGYVDGTARAFWMAVELRKPREAWPPHKDIDLIRNRLDQYYLANNRTLDAGGPRLRFGKQTGERVAGTLRLHDLVDPSELERPIAQYEFRFEASSVEVDHLSPEGTRRWILSWSPPTKAEKLPPGRH